VDTVAGHHGGAAGLRGPGVAAGAVQGGGRGLWRVAHRAGLYHAVPRARDGPLATCECAAARHDQARVVTTAGALLWAMATVLVDVSDTFLQVSSILVPAH
jgi:hypothetical protein